MKILTKLNFLILFKDCKEKYHRAREKLFGIKLPKFERKVCLHLGCGKSFFPGFIHIDLDNYPHIDHRRDIADLSIFTDNSVDLIYCRHALEYFNKEEAKTVLKEWHRVLKSGGILKLIVPNFETIVELYLKHRDLDHPGIGCLFGRMAIEGSSGRDWIYHKTVYDFNSLKKILEKRGFGNIRQDKEKKFTLELRIKAQKMGKK